MPKSPAKRKSSSGNQTPLLRGFIVYAHFAFIPGKGDNYLVSLDN